MAEAEMYGEIGEAACPPAEWPESEADVEAALYGWLAGRGCRPERQVPAAGGFADIVTPRSVVEVKKGGGRAVAFQAVGQAMAYAGWMRRRWAWVASDSPCDSMYDVVRWAGAGLIRVGSSGCAVLEHPSLMLGGGAGHLVADELSVRIRSALMGVRAGGDVARAAEGTLAIALFEASRPEVNRVLGAASRVDP